MTQLVPAALEFYAPISTNVDGSLGTNRAHSPSTLLQADNDLDAIKAWLAQYLGSLIHLIVIEKNRNVYCYGQI